MCVSQTAITGLCARSLLSLLHSCVRTLIAVNSTGVKASDCGQLKSHSARKDGWMLQGEGRAFIQHLALSFLTRGLEPQKDDNGPLHLKGQCSAYWRHACTSQETFLVVFVKGWYGVYVVYFKRIHWEQAVGAEELRGVAIISSCSFHAQQFVKSGQ